MMKENQQLNDKQEKTEEKSDDSKLSSEYNKKLSEFIDIISKQPIISLSCIGIIAILIFYYVSESKVENLANLEEERKSRTELSGIEKAVDPRARWTEEVLNEVKDMKNRLESLIENKYLETKNKIDDVQQKLELLESKAHEETILYDGNSFNNNQQVQDLTNEQHEQIITDLPAKRQFGYVKRAGCQVKKDVKDYITTGSFARGVLLTGAVVGTGTNNAAAPEPIMLRLVDTAIFSKGNKTEQIKEAILIGSCSGDISSERAKCRLETVSLLNRNGDIIEKSVEGWIIGEDGRPGIKGVVVDRSSDVARMAVLNGVLGGIAQFFQNQATNGVFPISPITGQQNALKAKDALKGGIYAGAGNALEKLADFAIKRAESMSPVIVVASGRVVDVVFRKGFDLKQDDASQNVNRLLPPTTTDYSQNTTNNQHYNNFNKVKNFSKVSSKLQERFIKDNEQEEYENNNLNNLHNVNWQEQSSQQQGNF
ncbi:TraB/VirB10 family protein [Candidatus Tisiphia endosymbiont of Metellina segmentata]|uniref:TraB/VirB10 family protein n=1 Tax=Candidatus Tisiphia endosymbiont of Metellina segmentata TaxID=3066274 RepID=UPI00313C7062